MFHILNVVVFDVALVSYAHFEKRKKKRKLKQNMQHKQLSIYLRKVQNHIGIELGPV